MAYRFLRSYRGPVKGVILDWSGTTADKYVLAPAVVFVEVFNKHKVPITMPEARGPMGLRKDLHIKAITENDDVRKRWFDVYGKFPDQGDVDNMFKDFVPMQLACLKKYTTLIPGTAEACKTLKNEFGVKIGSTTGFLRSMVDILLEEGRKQGYHPDVTVAGDEVQNGARPKPHMVYKNMDLLDLNPIEAVVKVDDTISGVGEALEAGCWGVGVAKYSNYMGVDSLEEADDLTPEEEEKRCKVSRDLLIKSGAHYVIDTIAELPEVIEDVNRRLARGEKP
ncbi:phosphonoacetaldehyde hydrolase-like [Pecten maximus]|uniref:phosphonoacetaldehyde hydrolase-like n=1 Tax=Pecten maximus TaxID=6579 RepID=UPI0014582087|nr:phosphonoacetaldehyde hydrolase-like [Pecten maximus]XP_033728739.1 phosphonoacetaldehyde hydrolase-like [Pecten maximus]